MHKSWPIFAVLSTENMYFCGVLTTMKKIFQLFTLRRDERWPALVFGALFAVLHGLNVWRYWDLFSVVSSHYHRLFVGNFRFSGFDPLTYETISAWTPAYNVYRHPLLAFFLWPLNQLDQGLIMLTGLNLAQVIVCAVWVLAAVYSFVFLYRILREVVEVKQWDAYLLALLFFSFAYVLATIAVPDHFCLSLMLLLLTLYVAGHRQRQGKGMSVLEAFLLFFFTAGVSLNNGLKVFAAALLTNRWRFFRPKFLLLAVLLPAALMWGFARWEYRTFVWPKEMARKAAKARQVKRDHDAVWQQYVDSTGAKDTTEIRAEVNKIIRQKAIEKYRRDHRQVWNRNAGKPIAKGEFSRWTDISTPRWESTVENVFGESIQLHEDHLLQDVLRQRPVIVEYRHWWNYAAECLLVGLFVVGIWCGRRERFLWTALSFFALDAALHVGLGFGLNEVYIMTAHWAFVIPIAIGYLMRSARGPWLQLSRVVIFSLAVFLLVHNVQLMLQFMLK